MCYQLPATITKDGQPIRGGLDINASDARFAGIIYPKILTTTEAPAAAVGGQVPTPRTPVVVDWDPDEDPVAAV
jgi:hypothetical protein